MRAPRQQQSRDVRAGDEQEYGNAGEQQPQGVTNAADRRLLERDHVDSESGVSFWILPSKIARHRLEVGTSLFEGDAALETADAHVPGQVPRPCDRAVGG